MDKHVSWSSDTKKHDGNPQYRFPYHKVTAAFKKHFPDLVKKKEIVSPPGHDMAWLDYCSASSRERGIVHEI